MVRIDLDLLYLSSESSRLRINEIGKLLRKSSQRLKYNLKTFEKEGIIKNPYAVFDYSYFGILLFKVYFKGAYISEKDREDIFKTLHDNPYITSIYELSGGYDLVLEFCTPNPSRFNKELKKISSQIPTLNNYKIILNVVSHLFTRQYLLKKGTYFPIGVDVILGGDRTMEQFSKNELSVLKTLLLNPNVKLTKLGKAANLNIKTSNLILNSLQERKVIKGFKYLIDINKVGIEKIRLFLKLHNLNPKRDQALLNFANQKKEIVQLNKTVGDWDMEIDIETFDRKKIREIIVELREEFKDIIQTFNLIEFFRYYKRSYIPMYLFDEKTNNL